MIVQYETDNGFFCFVCDKYVYTDDIKLVLHQRSFHMQQILARFCYLLVDSLVR